jgi:pSer/pThr/pTyr-binding forkhead associated (FHA) protein
VTLIGSREHCKVRLPHERVAPVHLEHIESGRVLQPNRNACLIGRRNGCDIVLAEPDVSRSHALLINYRDFPAIVDLASTIGTKVNDEPVVFRVLKDGDMITIGSSQFRVRIVSTAVPKAPKPAMKPQEDIEEPAAPIMVEEPEPDLIDIKSVEGSQRWRIAENVDKLEKAGRP